MGVLNNAEATFLNFLNSAIREYTFLFAVSKKHFYGAIWEADLLGLVWEVLLNLVVLELEHLETVGVSRLRCLCLCKKVDDFPSWEGLFDVLVLEKHHLIAVRPNFSLHTVRENDLFLAALVELLLFALGIDHFVNLNKVFVGLV